MAELSSDALNNTVICRYKGKQTSPSRTLSSSGSPSQMLESAGVQRSVLRAAEDGTVVFVVRRGLGVWEGG